MRGAAARSSEPAVVPQPPGRSRWDPPVARASRGSSEAAAPRRSWGSGGVCACNHFLLRPLGTAGLDFLHFAMRGASAQSPASPGLRSPLERARHGGGRPGPDKGREGGGGEAALGPGFRKGAPSAPAPALTFEDRAELLQGHGPRRPRSESARGGGGHGRARELRSVPIAGRRRLRAAGAEPRPAVPGPRRPPPPGALRQAGGGRSRRGFP